LPAWLYVSAGSGVADRVKVRKVCLAGIVALPLPPALDEFDFLPFVQGVGDHSQKIGIVFHQVRIDEVVRSFAISTQS
jgi:hypothetical protein